MVTVGQARVRLEKWTERLAYLEKEYRRLPGAIEAARGHIAQWEKRLLELEPPPAQLAPTGPLTRVDDRWKSRYEPGAPRRK